MRRDARSVCAEYAWYMHAVENSGKLETYVCHALCRELTLESLWDSVSCGRLAGFVSCLSRMISPGIGDPLTAHRRKHTGAYDPNDCCVTSSLVRGQGASCVIREYLFL